MKFSLKLSLLLGVVIFTMSCNKNGQFPCVSGNNILADDKRQLPFFDAIDSKVNANVDVRRSDDFRIEIRGYANQLQWVETKVSNGNLLITSDRCFKSADFTFVIYMPNISKLKMAGAAQGWIQEFDQNLPLNIEMIGTGKIISKVTAPQIEVVVTGSGGVELLGNSTWLTSTITGSGWIDAYALAVEKSFANITGSGTVKTKVSKQLIASINGSGLVTFLGNPIVQSNIAGSGRVVKE